MALQRKNTTFELVISCSSYGITYDAVPMQRPATRNKARGNRRLNTFLVSALYGSECWKSEDQSNVYWAVSPCSLAERHQWFCTYLPNYMASPPRTALYIIIGVRRSKLTPGWLSVRPQTQDFRHLHKTNLQPQWKLLLVRHVVLPSSAQSLNMQD